MSRSKPKLTVLSGAGISQESGLKTFRDSNGLWEGYRLEDVATPSAWRRNPQLVLDFYNERRARLSQAVPNAAHKAIAEAEKDFEVAVITQNVDDLHERAGSTYVIHLHGELTKARSQLDESLIYDIGYNPINLGDKCELGSQLRPHIVWFGERVFEMDTAIQKVRETDILLVVGTSLLVYPAAGLLEFAPSLADIFLIDPNPPEHLEQEVAVIAEKAGIGVPKALKMMREKYCRRRLANS